MGGGYSDAHAILAEETAMPVRFNTASAGLGRALDPASDAEDVAKDADVDLPLWMVQNLAARQMVTLRRELASADGCDALPGLPWMPAAFTEKMRRKLAVGAAVEDLRSRCPYFYSVAAELDRMIVDGGLASFVSSTFTLRYRELLIKAHSAAESAVEVSSIQQRLTLEERRIFDGGRAAVAAFDRWRHSDLVPHRRLVPQKRKLPQDADAPNGITPR